MSARKRHSVIRDPVHGDVYLTHEEVRVLDTREMQRLRGVKQLGTAYLVFPGAVHTRFDHSIGALHMAGKVIEAVNRSFGQDPAACVGIGDEEARLVRLAALVHDVTHIPFGHSIEDQDGIFERHDTPARFEAMLGPGTQLGRVLRELGAADAVLGILCGEKRAIEPASNPRNPEHFDYEPGSTPASNRRFPPHWSQIVSGTVACDILDYLARDAHFTGLKLAVDPRVTSYFKVDRASGNLYVDLVKHDLLREDILSEIVRLLEARYYFSERVYFHHAKVAAGALVARAVDLALAEGAVQEADFHDQTDESVLDLLERRAARVGESSVRICSLLARFRERRLPKRAAVFPRQGNESAQEGLVSRYFAAGGREARAQAEARIADLARFATGRDIDVIVYCPARTMQLKEAHMHVRWPGSAVGVEPLARHAGRVPRLADLERCYRDLWKFYVFADTDEPALLAKVAEAAREEFSGAVNAYGA